MRDKIFRGFETTFESDLDKILVTETLVFDHDGYRGKARVDFLKYCFFCFITYVDSIGFSCSDFVHKVSILITIIY